MLQSLEIKHVLILMVATCAALGFYFWNRTCILSAEIEQLSTKVDQCKEAATTCHRKESFREVMHDSEPEPSRPRHREKRRRIPEIDPEIEVVYGGEESKRAATVEPEKK